MSSRLYIDFTLDDDLDSLPSAGFQRVYKGQKRFDDNVNSRNNVKKRSGNHVVRKDKVDFDRDDN